MYQILQLSYLNQTDLTELFYVQWNARAGVFYHVKYWLIWRMVIFSAFDIKDKENVQFMT